MIGGFVMVYASKIKDSMVIQLIILFTLNEAKKPIKRAVLDRLIFENCIINFADYSIAIENLEELKFIHEISGEMMYRITEEGIQTLGFFKDRIPGFVRESIKEAVVPVLWEEKCKNSIKTELLPYNEIEFMSQCEILEGEKPLIRLELYAGSRDDAKEICDIFKKNADEIYGDIVKIFEKYLEN